MYRVQVAIYTLARLTIRLLGLAVSSASVRSNVSCRAVDVRAAHCRVTWQGIRGQCQVLLALMNEKHWEQKSRDAKNKKSKAQEFIHPFRPANSRTKFSCPPSGIFSACHRGYVLSEYSLLGAVFEQISGRRTATISTASACV